MRLAIRPPLYEEWGALAAMAKKNKYTPLSSKGKIRRATRPKNRVLYSVTEADRLVGLLQTGIDVYDISIYHLLVRHEDRRRGVGSAVIDWVKHFDRPIRMEVSEEHLRDSCLFLKSQGFIGGYLSDEILEFKYV